MSVQSPLATVGGKGANAFFGRSDELARIGSSLEALLSGHGVLDLVSGTCGIGKTRLLREAAERAQAHGCRVLCGGAWEGDGAPAFWPWIEVLRSHPSSPSEVLNTAPAADFREVLRTALETREPGAFVLSPDIGTDAHQARFALFDRFCDLLTSLARDSPLLVILDDMQWADSASLLLLQFVANRMATLPVWICAASRDPIPDALSISLRHPWAHHLPLTGLSREHIQTLLVTAGCPATGKDLAYVIQLSEGNPYFATELGTFVTHLTSPDPVSPVRLSIPPTLIALVHQQLAGRSEHCRNMLHVAAAIGRTFDISAVAAGLSMRPDIVFTLLQEAFDAHILVPSGLTSAQFVHALWREAIYEALPFHTRTRLHRRLATLHEASSHPSNHSAELATHLLYSFPLCDRGRLVASLQKAGQYAYNRYAFEDSCAYFGQALAVSDADDTPMRCDLLLGLGSAQIAAGRFPEWRSTFLSAADTARRVGSSSLMARAALGLRGLMWATIPPDMEAILLLEEAASRLAFISGELDLKVDVLTALSRALYFASDPSAARSYIGEAAALAALITTDARPAARVLETRIISLLEARNAASILPLADELDATAVSICDPLLRSSALLFRHYALRTLGRAKEADTTLDYLAEIAKSTHNLRINWLATLLQSARATQRGELEKSGMLLEIASDLGSRVHDSTRFQYEITQRFYAALLHDEVQDWAERAAMIGKSLPDVPAFRACRGLLAARIGDPEEARRQLQPFILSGFCIPWNHATLWTYALIAETVHILSDTTSARKLVSILSPASSLHVVAGWGVALDGSFAYYLALLSETAGDPSSARRYLESAIREHTIDDAPILVARAQLAYARILNSYRLPTDTEHPDTLARSACRAFDALGLARRAQQARRMLDSATPPANANAPASSTSAKPAIAALHAFKDHWTVTYCGQSAVLRPCIGLQFLSAILAAEGSPVHVNELIALQGPLSLSSDAARATLDRDAVKAYRARLRDLHLSLEAAEANNDEGERLRALRERELLEKELSRQFGWKGRERSASAERARIRVRNRLSTAIRNIERAHPSAGAHLRASVRTGTLCVYRPPEPLRWDISLHRASKIVE